MSKRNTFTAVSDMALHNSGEMFCPWNLARLCRGVLLAGERAAPAWRFARWRTRGSDMAFYLLHARLLGSGGRVRLLPLAQF